MIDNECLIINYQQILSNVYPALEEPVEKLLSKITKPKHVTEKLFINSKQNC